MRHGKRKSGEGKVLDEAKEAPPCNNSAHYHKLFNETRSAQVKNEDFVEIYYNFEIILFLPLLLRILQILR